MKNQEKLLRSDISGTIIGCCFDVMKDLGSGFLENVYKNALYFAMKEKGLNVTAEQSFQVMFKTYKIGKYIADLIVENLIVVELKCCRTLLPEHKAQLINYLKASKMPIGLLVNFGNPKLEYKRLHHPDKFIEAEKPDDTPLYLLSCPS